MLPGINAKMNEFAAAMGLAILEQLDEELEKRAAVARIYEEALSDLEGIELVRPGQDVTSSRQYFVIRVRSGFGLPDRDSFVRRMNDFNVFPRRYFHPLCSATPHYQSLPSAASSNLPQAVSAANEVIALPFYGRLLDGLAERVVEIIRFVANEQRWRDQPKVQFIYAP